MRLAEARQVLARLVTPRGAVLTLSGFLAVALVGMVVLAVPDASVKSAPDTMGYMTTAKGLAALDPHALFRSRAFLYPLLVAVHRATGLPHHWTVSLFNLAAVCLLVWRLHARRMRGAALATAGVALVLFLSPVNMAYSAIYLRESVVLGVSALHLAFLVEAVRGPWRLPARLGLTALALLTAYHFKGLYAYLFVAAGPFLIWAQMRASGRRGGALMAGGAVLATLVLVAGTWATNPNNDARRKGLTLLGVLVNSPIPAYYAAHPDALNDREATRDMAFMAFHMDRIRAAARDRGVASSGISPHAMDRFYEKQYGQSLAARGEALFWQAARDRPLPFALFLLARARYILPPVWLSPTSVCRPTWGLPRGLPVAACRPVAWCVFASWLVVPLLAVGLCLRRRRVPTAAAAAVGLWGMGTGLALVLCIVGYSDFERLSIDALMYGALSLPLVVALLRDASSEPSHAAPAGVTGPLQTDPGA